MKTLRRTLLSISLTLLVSLAGRAAASQANGGAYAPSAYDQADRKVTLDGGRLTIDELVGIARHGARVEVSPQARRRSAEAYGLLLEGAAEGVTIYWFNRGSGAQRETVIFSGDPTSPENAAQVRARQLEAFAADELGAYGPEIANEDVVRAMMAIRLNTLSYEAASPGLLQGLADLLNHRITPVVRSRGTLGEGDLAPLADIGRVLIGRGEAYYQGRRMSAAQALGRAGLKPFEPAGADDSALTSSNAYAVAQAALLVADSRALLDWTDLATAMAMLGMNSSITPISEAAQSARPVPWLNWDAARVLGTLRGTYLLENDPKRIIQDPESLRASTQRTGAAWQSWAALSGSVTLAMNSSDHNPAVRPGLKPSASWELSTPQMMRFYVRGGPLSHGQFGYIVSTANWDPYPLANDVEAFTIALGNLGVALSQRIERFNNPFFTGVSQADVLTPQALRALPTAGGYLPADLWSELTTLLSPVTPQGQAIVGTVEDLQAETRLKLERARSAEDLLTRLLALDIITSSNWIEVRRAQEPARSFGAPVARMLSALREALPPRGPSDTTRVPDGERVYAFMRDRSAREFLPAAAAAPSDDPAAGARSSSRP